MSVRTGDLPGRPPGFALPLAVTVLVAVTLIAAMMLDGALTAFRTARADVELSRADAEAESALAEALAARLESGHDLTVRVLHRDLGRE